MATHANGNNGGFIPRYGMIISTVGVAIVVVGGFWGAVINPIAVRMDKMEDRLEARHITIREHEEFKNRLDREIAAIREVQKQAVPRAEHEARWTAFERDIAAISLRQSDAQKLVVPRDELNGRLGYLESNFKLLSDRISELRSQITAPYPVREQVERLTTELLEQRKATSAEIAELRRQLQGRNN